MAITPRTIFTSPAPATVAAVSLLAFTAVGTLAYKVAQDSKRPVQTQAYHATTHEAMCQSVRETLGHDKSRWSESDWIVYAGCFEHRNNPRMTVAVATQGLRYYPHSEPLYNIKGYHQIVLDEHEAAVDTLSEGLRRVGEPATGTMANNLAWAGLWVPREMKLDRARKLYRESLRTDPNVCETLHTGLWVEYAVARKAQGVEKYQALKNFFNLRRQYEPCTDRVESGEWDTLVEVIGASVIFSEVDESMSVPSTLARRANSEAGEELREATSELREHYRGASLDALCREAMPLADTHHDCVERVDATIKALKAGEATSQRKVIDIKVDTAPSPCPFKQNSARIEKADGDSADQPGGGGGGGINVITY